MNARAAIQLQNHHSLGSRRWRHDGFTLWCFLQSSDNASVRLEDTLTQLPNIVNQIIVKLKRNEINSLTSTENRERTGLGST